MKKRRGSAPSPGPLVTTAARFARSLNGYLIQAGPPRTIVLPSAFRLVGVEQVTVTGRLLKNQIARANMKTGKRTFVLGPKRGQYSLGPDGSLRLCLGAKQGEAHISCELVDGAPWALLLNNSVGEKVSVSGFLQCRFDESGFESGDDTHLFRICPVRAIGIRGALYSFDSGSPAQTSVEPWPASDPDDDCDVHVQYWKGSDTLVFSNLPGWKRRLVRLSGKPTSVKLNLNRNRAAWFMLHSAEASRLVKVSCLQGTAAATHLRRLNAERVSVIGFPHVDLDEALNDKYVIRVLALNIRAET